MFSRVLLVSLLFASSQAFSEEECLNYTVYPVQYELAITPYIFLNELFSYNCDLVITIIANAPNVNVIELDVKDLDIKSSVQVLEGSVDLVNRHRPFEVDKGRGKLYIYLREPLRVFREHHTQYSIRLSFTKYLSAESAGVFVVKYHDGGPKYMLTTRLSPNKAKYFFPCFEDLRFETVYKFRVLSPAPHAGLQTTNCSLVIANQQHVDRKNEFTTIEYVPSPQVAIYQLGFHHTQFESRQVTAAATNDTLVVWAPASFLHQYTYTLKFGEAIINLIHEYSKINRPLVNGPISLVPVPTVMDGYEIGSWNLLSNGDYRLAYIPVASSIEQRNRLEFQLTQQLCRVWLGNPGEPAQTRWREQWFKEGVATYLAYYFLNQYHSKESPMWEVSYPDLKEQAMWVDWHHSTPTLASFNQTLAVEIPPRYRDLVAMKTASVLWMLENWIGSEKFHAALVRYINSRRGQYISLEDFKRYLDLATVECKDQFFSGHTASNILDSWFHRSGYPVINVGVLRNEGKPDVVYLKQRQFSFTAHNRGDTDFLIPISYIVQNNQNCYNCYRPQFTIDIQTYTFAENLNNGWIIINRNGTGYFRVNYEASIWNLIAQTLEDNHVAISPLNRAQLVSDVLALHAAGLVPRALAERVLGYLRRERSARVWRAAAAGLRALTAPGAACNVTRRDYEQWQEFMRNEVAQVYNSLAVDIRQDTWIREFRSFVREFACELNYQPCINDLRRIVDSARVSGTRLEPDGRQACYYMLQSAGGELQYDRNNRFELDDQMRASHKLADERKFLYKIPRGHPKPVEMIMTTEEPQTARTEASKNALKGGSSNSNISLKTAFGVAAFTFMLR